MTSGQNNRIIFFGTEDFSAVSLQALIDNGFQISAVVTKPDSKKGRGHHLAPPLVKVIAQKYDIPVLQPTKLSDIHEHIESLQPVTGVLVSFGKIIPQSIIDLFTPGIINVHPSLLPLYRGPSPIETAMIHGDSKSGVSIMKLSAAMDAGPVYEQKVVDSIASKSKLELYDMLGSIGAATLVRLLPEIMNGIRIATPQNDSNATYCQLISKHDGSIDWNKPAAQLEREVRAYSGWPGSRATLNGIEVIVTKAHTSTADAKHAVQCGDGNYLIIDMLKPTGKKEMPIEAFLAGHGNRLTI